MRVLLEPKWIAGHLLVLLVAVTFVNLGLWQMRRHDEKAQRNSALAEATALPPEPLEELPAGERAYRRTAVAGHYTDGEVLLTPRNERGPGHHVLTPLRTERGALVLVDRGWVPYRFESAPVPGAEAPEGRVELSGVLLPATEVDPKAVRDDDGRLLRVAAVPPRLILGEASRTPDRVEDVYLLLREQRPATAELPVAGPAPEPDAGPHLSYAIQWFLFTAVALIGYPLLLRRTVRDASDNMAKHTTTNGDTPVG